jgi:hypothetical protein
MDLIDPYLGHYSIDQTQAFHQSLFGSILANTYLGFCILQSLLEDAQQSSWWNQRTIDIRLGNMTFNPKSKGRVSEAYKQKTFLFSFQSCD